MSLLTTLRKDKMQALKDKDTVKNGIRTGLRSKRAETNKGYVSADPGQPSGIDRRNAA